MLQISCQDGIHVLTLDHGKANTLDTELCAQLADSLEGLAGQTEAVVLTGTGHCFCAGVDLLAIKDGGVDEVARFLPELIRAFRALFEFPKPMVAAINGHAIAGGCVIACAADLRIMSNSTGRIGMAELAVGVPLPAAAIEIVRFAGHGDRLQEILYLAQGIRAADALAMGLVDSMEEPENLMQSALQLAAKLARIPARSFKLTKQRVRQPVVDMLNSGSCRSYDLEIMQAWQSPEILGAIEDFVKQTLGR